MTNEEAWFLGFLLSDGCLQEYDRREEKKGIEKYISFTLKDTDIEVLEKLKKIINTTAAIRTYPNYKSPQAKIYIYDRKDLFEKYRNIKTEIPDDIYGFERHFIRGIVDGDGCLYYRNNRKSMRISIINENKTIIEWISASINKNLKIPYKSPYWKEKDHLWVLDYEGRVAKAITYYLYHGQIEHMCLLRKYEYYKQCVYKQNLIEILDLKIEDNIIHMNVPSNNSLKWCQIVQSLLEIKTSIIPLNKGQEKYYALYLPKESMVNMWGPSLDGEGIVH